MPSQLPDCDWILRLTKSPVRRLPYLCVVVVLLCGSFVSGSVAADNDAAPKTLVVIGETSGMGSFLREQGLQVIGLAKQCAEIQQDNCLAQELGQDHSEYLLVHGASANSVWALACENRLPRHTKGLFLIAVDLPALSPCRVSMPVWLFTAVQHDQVNNIAARRLARDSSLLGMPVQHVMVPGTTPDQIMHFRTGHLAAAIILDRLGVTALADNQRRLLRLTAQWQQTRFDSEEFWLYKKLVQRIPVSQALTADLYFFFDAERYRLQAWPLKHYYALDLFDFLRASGLKQERHLIIRNLRGEVLFLDLQQIRAQQPVIVIGLDDEKNLFRLVNFYRTRQQYSWFPAGTSPAIRARPLGAFLHFRELDTGSQGTLAFRSALLASSFTVSAEDPTRTLESEPLLLQQVLTRENQCIHCHEFRGVGGRAHHIDASFGIPAGGYALPLRGYPRKVLTAFLYDQVNVARTIGVTPNHVRADAHPLLLNSVYGSGGANQP